MKYGAILLGLLMFSAQAQGAPWWADWEDGWPETQGWHRVWGNWQGWHQGQGANRRLHDGVLTFNTITNNNTGIYDYFTLQRPGGMDPGPGELFVMEWRLRVDLVVGWRADLDAEVCSDEAWCLAFEYGTDRMYSAYEGDAEIPFTPGLFHDYRVVSADMRAYDLFIDGQPARHGAFTHLVGPPEVYWGKAGQGMVSLSDWDYYRVGVMSVVPEPSSILLLLVPVACCVRRRGHFMSHVLEEKPCEGVSQQQ